MNVLGHERMTGGLLDASHTVALEELPALVRKCAGYADLHDVLIYLVDLQQGTLRLLTGHGLTAGEGSQSEVAEFPVEGSAAGQAFQYVRNTPEPCDQEDREDQGRSRQCWVPLVNGTERLGVLRVRAELTDQHTVAAIGHLAALTALLVVSRLSQSDSYYRLVRSRPMNVAAEMQWKLMPPLTFANKDVTIGAIFEPAYEIAGDSFDYALAGDTVHLAVFDAMGHDVAAGLTANLAVAACRNNRRQGVALADIGGAIESALLDQHFEGVRFLTALIADLNTRTGILTWTNHGHHPPTVIRDNHWISSLDCAPGHPLGTDLGVRAAACTEQLEPGDRILFYTDGITEARNPKDGSEFGVERLVSFLTRHNGDGLPLPEVLRRLMRSILDYHDGRLQDDATILFLEWRGTTDPSPRALS